MRSHTPRIVILLFGTMLLSTCATVPAPSGSDLVPPRLTMTVLDGIGTPAFSTGDTVSSMIGACAEVRRFPARVSVSAADDGGVTTLTISAFPGRIEDVSVAPDSAGLATTRDASRGLESVTITPHPPDGRVQPNLLVSFTVSELSAIVASARDVRGNQGDLYQIDLRPSPSAPFICRH